MKRAGAFVALALLVFGCGSGEPVGRRFYCLKDGIRYCTPDECPNRDCFIRPAAHCMRNSTIIRCLPSAEECAAFIQKFSPLFEDSLPVCSASLPDELPRP